MDRLPVRPRTARDSSARVEMLERRRLLHAAPHDPAMMEEHMAVMALVPDAAVTHAAVSSGAWSAPQTWRDGRVPGAESNVLVPAGVTVTVDRVESAALRTVRVDGTLSFATAVDTQLAVDTLVVTPEGTLVIGTAADPVRPDVTARVVFPDRGPIDTIWDPRLFSRGLLAHGTTTMYGATKTPFAALSGPAMKGAATLSLAEAPRGWRPGDELVVTGTSSTANQDEKLTIVGVAGRVVRVNKPLAWTHAAPQPDLPLYVANLTRNVVFASENQQPTPGDISRRGHVMFVHSPHVDVNHAAFDHLGRTDKSVRVNDPRVEDHAGHGGLVPGTGTNARGRYPVHFHRTGTDASTDPPATVRGSVVDEATGWGYTNHSSHVVFEENVSHNVFGAGFVAEAGDEIGAFRRNLALRSAGSGETITGRTDVQDFGHQGNGFWFQGAGTEVTGNVAAGHRAAAFAYFTRGLQQAGSGVTRFPARNLPPGIAPAGAATVDVGDVPVRAFRGNYAFASGEGFESWFHLLDATHPARSVVEGFTTWGNRSGRGVFIPYTRHLTLRDLRTLGNPKNPAGLAVSGNDATDGIDIDNARVEGFEVGIVAPRRGSNRVRGGLLNNVKNVTVAGALGAGRSLTLSAVRLGRLSTAALRGRRQFDVYLEPEELSPAARDLSQVFTNDTVRVNGRQLYRPEQAASFVPYPDSAGGTPAYVPPELVGKTNRQLYDQYGLAVGGAVAPGDSADLGRPRTNGLAGDPVAPLRHLTLDSRKYTNKLADYQLRFTPDGGSTIRHPWTADLRPGWNLITRAIGGRPRTFFVFGDLTPPTVLPAAPLVINPLALPRGLTVRATVVDDSIGETTVTRTYTDLPSRPVQTRNDGTRFIALDFRTTDLAGNPVAATLELTLDPAAAL